MAKSLKTLTITRRLKSIIHRNITNNINFNIDNLFNYPVDTNKEITEVLKDIPLLILFDNIEKEDNATKCILFKSHKAWISSDSTGHQRYFSKGKKEELYSFDLLDILEFYYNKPLSQIFPILIEKFSISTDNNWQKIHQQKYINNLQILNQLSKYKEYEYLNNSIKKYIDILVTINTFGENNIKNQAFVYKQQNIFFFSIGHLLENSRYKSKATINKLVNWFCLLGLVEKIPNKYLETIKRNMGISSNPNYNPLTFYIVPQYNDKILKMANERARYLINKNYKYYKLKNLGYITLSATFNASNIVIGNNKNASKPKIISTKIVKCFDKMLTEHNMVSKELIAKTVNCSKKTIDVLWVDLMQQNNLISRRPTNKEKKMYSLNTNLYIGTKMCA